MFVEIICDGTHLPPELIKLIYKIKGPERIALVTDSLALAGTDQTYGFMQSTEFIIEDGVCKLMDRSAFAGTDQTYGFMQSTEFIIEDGVCKLMDRSAFAGSIATADRLISVAVKEAGISVTDAVKMLTEIPAKIMRLSHKGTLECGKDADIVIFDADITVKKVFARGISVKA